MAQYSNESREWPPWRNTGLSLRQYDELALVGIFVARTVWASPTLGLIVGGLFCWAPAVRTYGWQEVLQLWPQSLKRRILLPIHILGGAILLLLTCAFINWLITIIFYHGADATAMPQDPNFGVMSQASQWELIMIGVSGVLTTPLYEELTFRLCLVRLIERHLPFEGAAFASALIFAMLHRPVAYVPAMFYFGAIQCMIQRRYGTVACIATHALYNLAVFITFAHYA